MPWRGPEYPGEFPTLGDQVAALIEAKCVIPDGDHQGEPFTLTDEQLRFLLWFYRVNPEAHYDTDRGVWRSGFVYFRGGQLVRPQKWGKGPFSSAHTIAECHPEGPVRFDGWDADGEPVGRPWATPWAQVTALSEGQTDNVWRSLVPMIELGDLAADMPDTGDTRIKLAGGWIEPVTSAAQSRQGQRITWAVQDESHSWTARNGGRKLADTQRRNLGGTGGRFLETTNAWDPAEQSVAQQTAEGDEPGVYLDDVDPGPGSIRNKRERRKCLRRVYGDSWWVDLDRIDGEIEALLRRDPAQAERFYLNRKHAAENAAFDADRWKQLADATGVVPDRSLIVLGVDGARFDDALAVVATDVATAHQFVVGIWERPPDADADDGYEHPADEVDGAVSETWDRFDVWRLYVDPQWIDHLVSLWQGRWGEERVVSWFTHRPRQTGYMLRSYRSAMSSGPPVQDGRPAGLLTHDGDEKLTRHIGNARRRQLNVKDDDGRPLWTIAKDYHGSANKIDAAMAAGLAWEARTDALAADALKAQRRRRKAVFL